MMMTLCNVIGVMKASHHDLNVKRHLPLMQISEIQISHASSLKTAKSCCTSSAVAKIF